MAYTGRCLCGSVRFSLPAEPVTARACWCRDCQYWATGNAALNVVFPSEGMTVEGEVATYESTASSGTPMRRSFCPKCGTPLFSQALTRLHQIIVRAGALDDEAVRRPKGTIWTASAPEWGHIDPELPSVPGQPAPPPAPSGG